MIDFLLITEINYFIITHFREAKFAYGYSIEFTCERIYI